MFVTWLPDLTSADIALAGGKGAHLGQLAREGLAVPPGFVLTTDAYRAVTDPLRERILAAADDEPDAAASEIAGILAGATLPHALRRELGDAHVELTRGRPDAAVAVRSSATAEDLEDASFAGLHDTFLNVRGEAELEDAVRRCWASLWTPRAIAYRRHLGIDPAYVALAVVVQVLVDATSSGVAFSLDPTTGRRDRVTIDATWGLGEALVSGRVTPDHLLVEGHSGRVLERTTSDKRVRTVRTPEGTAEEPLPEAERRRPVLTDEDAAELASTVAAIAELAGTPQDVEWARDDERFWVVQARPVTAVADEVGPIPVDWPVARKGTWYFRASIVEQMPDPLAPLFGDLIGPAVMETVAAMMERFVGKGAVRPGDASFDRINGYGYLAYGIRAIGRVTLMAIPGMIKLNLDPESSAQVLWTRMHADYVAAVDEAEASDLTEMTATQLLQQVRALLRAGARYYTSVQTVIPQAATAEIYFTRAYAALGRLPGVRVEDFLLGLDSEPIRADKALWGLAQWVRSRPGLADAVASAAVAAPEGVAVDDWAEWRRRFGAHLAAYGHTVYNLDFANPVPADDPAPILEALRYYLGPDARSPIERQDALRARRDAAVGALDRRGGVRGRTLRRLLRTYERYGPMREDALADVGLAWPRMRRNLAELGARFAAAGLIPAADDVFWLTEAEAAGAASAVDAGASLVPNTRIEDRKATWRGRKLARPPQLLGAGGWVWRRFMPSVEKQSGDELKGIGSSGGVATGPARVIRSTADFAEMRPGEVLVAEITTPAYTPLFALASAVVTDVGGPLSHSSIVAREYGIPAVLGTGSATARITTGQVVTVDGTRGVVRLTEA